MGAPAEDELAEWVAVGVCRCPTSVSSPEGWCAHGLALWWLIRRSLDDER